MPVWLVRAGSRGERQDLALDQNVSAIGWDDLPDLTQFHTREELEAAFRRIYPDAKPRRITNWVGQVWAFAKRIERDDLIAA